MSWADMISLAKRVILSWPFLMVFAVAVVFVFLIFYVADHNKDVLDYYVPNARIRKGKKKK